MDLVGPVGDAQRADVRPHVGQRGVLADAGGSVGLDGTVDDRQGGVGDQDLGLGDLLQRGFRVGGVDDDRGVEHDETGGVDLDSRLGHPFQKHAVRAEHLAERFLARVVQTRDHPFERSLGRSNGSHRVVDSSRDRDGLG